MKLRSLAMLWTAFTLERSDDPRWCAMPSCSPHELSICLTKAAAHVGQPPSHTEAVAPVTSKFKDLEIATRLTGGLWDITVQRESDVLQTFNDLRARRVFPDTPALRLALDSLARNASDSWSLAEVGWLYVLVNDRVRAAEMFRQAAQKPFIVFQPGTSPVDGLVRLGCLDDALSAARSMHGDAAHHSLAMQEHPAALGVVARALFKAGRQREASQVLVDAYQLADKLPRGRTAFGFGSVVDRVKFRAYAALIQVQLDLGDRSGAFGRASIAKDFRLALISDHLKRIELLRDFGATIDATRRLLALLAQLAGPQSTSEGAQYQAEYLPAVAVSIVAGGTFDGGLAVVSNLSVESRRSFATGILSQRSDCDHSQEQARSLADKLKLHSTTVLLVEAAVVCIRARQDGEASKLLKVALDSAGRETPSSDFEDVAFLACGLQKTDIAERAILASLRSDGGGAGVLITSLRRAALVASELLEGSCGVVEDTGTASVISARR